MSVIGLHGIPGSGKTVCATAIGLKHFKKENRKIKQFIRYLKKEEIIVNNVFSNYPILLNKRKKIYSNVIGIDDLDNRYSFPKNSIIILDEVQAFYDSYRDFKKFPSGIATFFQFHRHFGIKDIYIISQHPRRLLTYIRDVISQYHRIKKFLKLRILGIRIVCYRRSYEFEDFTDSFTKNKDLKKLLEIKTCFYIFKLRKVFKAFDSKYLYILNSDKPLLEVGNYNSLSLESREIEKLENKLF